MAKQRTRPSTTQRGPLKAPMLDSRLAYAYAPLLPYLKRINKKLSISREGSRRHNPDDILLPKGYVAEVIATGFNAPVHCAFDNEGNCYVSECGHKIDSKPRILKVNVQTGEYERRTSTCRRSAGTRRAPSPAPAGTTDTSTS